MTCKVRRDFKIITDVLSRVSLVTSIIRGSSICSPKSLYKQTSNEILAELKAVVKTGALKVPEASTRPIPVCYDLSVRRVSNSQLSPTPRHHREEGRRRTQLKWTFRVVAIIAEKKKTTAIFSSLTFEFEYFIFCRLLSLQHKTFVLWYISRG